MDHYLKAPLKIVFRPLKITAKGNQFQEDINKCFVSLYENTSSDVKAVTARSTTVWDLCMCDAITMLHGQTFNNDKGFTNYMPGFEFFFLFFLVLSF